MQMKLRNLAFGVAGIFLALALYFTVDAWMNVGRYPQKVWLHRCNSIEKLHQMGDLYPNVEVDVVFRGNVFDVTHDIDVSFGLDLEEYFAHFSRNEGKMWLDVKNLAPENRDTMLAVLNSLVQRYGVARERLVVESPQWKLLDDFTKEGFYTSMYVAYDKPENLSGRELQGCIEDLRRVVDSGCVRAISFPYWWYSAIKGSLERSVDMLTWKHRSGHFLFMLSGEGKRMLEDTQLKVVLVKDKGDFHR